MDLLDKIANRKARMGVIGLGYVGLPLAVEFAAAGFEVWGIDLQAGKVDAINRGESYIPDVETKRLNGLVKEGRLRATTDYSMLKELDTVSICVPTPLRKTKDPDVSFIVDSVEEIAKYLHPQQLVILESTTYPGTTEELILPKLQSTGLEVGKDFFLAFSPERVDPGNAVHTTKNIPKVVGGVTPQCTEMAAAFYQSCLSHVVPVSSTRVAEMVKLLENTFRSVNIGLVNEMALMCHKLGVDVWEVIDAAASKPFGFMPFYPGPGLGGHCIPIDPFYLSWKAKQTGFEARFIELAGQVNSSMPYHIVTIVTEVLNDREKSLRGSNILVLGVAYKRDVDDVRESPAIDIIEMLLAKGAKVSFADPHVSELQTNDESFTAVPVTAETLRGTDCVVIIADHRAFDYDLIAREAPLIVDTRNALKDMRGNHIRRL